MAGVLILLSVSLFWFSCKRLFADMQMQVANVAFANYDINTAQLYLVRAIKMNPWEKTYLKNLEIVKSKRNQLERLAKEQLKKKEP